MTFLVVEGHLEIYKEIETCHKIVKNLMEMVLKIRGNGFENLQKWFWKLGEMVLKTRGNGIEKRTFDSLKNLVIFVKWILSPEHNLEDMYHTF